MGERTRKRRIVIRRGRQTIVTHLIGAYRQRVSVNRNQREIEIFAVKPQWGCATHHRVAPYIERRGDVR